MSRLHISLSSAPTNPQSFSFLHSISPCRISLPTLTIKPPNFTFKLTPICMGGGPRTFPGGVSKWQWKRMQRNKSKQLLKARLARERQIYEMRKRAELKAAVSELERPWETVEKPPNLFSVSADDQLKVLADRFQKPGGLDLWSERDGPELFRPDNGLPSARFFPKGVVHSLRPYGKVAELGSGDEENLVGGEGSVRGDELVRRGERRGNVRDGKGRSSGGNLSEGRSNVEVSRRTYSSNLEKINSLITKGGYEGEDTGAELVGNEYYGKSRTRGGSLDLGGENVSDVRSRTFGGNVIEGKKITRGNRRTHIGDQECGEHDEEMAVQRNGYYSKSRTRRSSFDSDGGNVTDDRSRSSGGSVVEGRGSREGNRRAYSSDSEKMNRGNGSFSKYDGKNTRRENGPGEFRRSRSYQKGEKRNSEVFDMSLQHDGSYGVKLEN